MTHITTINPATGTTLESYTTMADNHLNEIVRQSEQGFHKWRDQPLEQRCHIIHSIGSLLEAHRDELAFLMVTEMGKTIGEAAAEVSKSARLCYHFAAAGQEYLQGRDIPLANNRHARVRFEPTGVVLGIMPWNFPIWQVIRFAIPTILVGNTVVLKHAENVTGTALKLNTLLAQSKLCDNVFNLILCDHTSIENIIAHPAITGVSLTGSTRAGKAVAAVAGKNLKKLVLELGGSDPYLVLSDSDIEEAAKICVKSRMINNGQSCIAAKRIIVAKEISDDFTAAFCKHMASYKMGNPLEASTKLGPLARQDLLDNLELQVKDIVQSGATVKMGGQRGKSSGYYFPPTVLTDIKDPSIVNNIELFGPVATILVGESTEELIGLANSSCYGLGAAVFSQDLERAKQIAAKLASGTVAINDMVQSDPRTPFGGIKESGLGREMSEEGIKEFCNIKAITSPF